MECSCWSRSLCQSSIALIHTSTKYASIESNGCRQQNQYLITEGSQSLLCWCCCLFHVSPSNRTELPRKLRCRIELASSSRLALLQVCWKTTATTMPVIPKSFRALVRATGASLFILQILLLLIVCFNNSSHHLSPPTIYHELLIIVHETLSFGIELGHAPGVIFRETQQNYALQNVNFFLPRRAMMTATVMKKYR